MAKPKGGQKLVQQAKKGRIMKGLKEAKRKWEIEQGIKEFKKRQMMRPRRRGEPSLAGGRRKGSPSV